LGVLDFGLSIDGKIGVGIFPNAEEFFVGFAGVCVIAHQPLCPTELKPGQWPVIDARHKPGLSISFWNSPAADRASPDSRLGRATDVGRVEIIERLGECEVVPNSPAEQIDGGSGIMLQLDRGAN
jgi:hypothetical protein